MKSIIQKRIIPPRTQSQGEKFPISQTSRPREVRRSGQATIDMIHHSKNCATLSIVQDKGCYSDLFTSNKELVLKLKRLDFLSNQSWAAHKGCLPVLGEQLSRIAIHKNGRRSWNL